PTLFRSRSAGKTAIHVLGQMHREHPAGCSARAVHRARSTRLRAEHTPWLEADQVEHLGDPQPRPRLTKINATHDDLQKSNREEEPVGTRNREEEPVGAPHAQSTPVLTAADTLVPERLFPFQKRSSSKSSRLRSMWY